MCAISFGTDTVYGINIICHEGNIRCPSLTRVSRYHCTISQIQADGIKYIE